MISHRSISRVGFLSQTYRICGPRFDDVSRNYSLFSGLHNPKGEVPRLANAATLRTLGMKLGYLKLNDKVSLPSALSFRSDIHSTCAKEFEDRPKDIQRGAVRENDRETEGSQSTRSMDFQMETTQETGRDIRESQFTWPMGYGKGITQETGRDMRGSQVTRSMDFARGSTQENRGDMAGFQLTRSMDFGKFAQDMGGSQFTRSMDFERGNTQENRGDMGGSQLTRSLGFGRFTQNMGGSQFTRSMDFERGNTQENRGDIGGFQLTRSMDFGRRFTQDNGRYMGGSQLTRSMDFARRGNSQENRGDVWGSQRTRSMDFVRGIVREKGRDTGLSQLSRLTVEKDPDIVHVKLLRGNAFVTVTDSKGNKKIGASSGALLSKTTRYAAEAAAEHVGRLAKSMGLKSFVVKVNGFTYFKKKKQAILSFRDGFTNSRSDQNPIVYIEDTTRLAHNGCRLRKKRRS